MSKTGEEWVRAPTEMKSTPVSAIFCTVSSDTLPEASSGILPLVINTASRMEGLTRYYKSSILLSEYSLVEITDPSLFSFRYLGQVRVKGRETPIGVYECFDGDPPAVIEKKHATGRNFELGLKAYFSARFSEALHYFEQVLKIFPDDPVSNLYQQKAKQYLESGVPDDWTGVEVMLFK